MFTIEERLGLIKRIVASEPFRRSVRLRDFLLYIGGQSLKEGCPEINEHEIGVRVFGRPLTYDRSQDNIVRVNATELRKRLALYFASQGANEPIIVSIPPGSYKPHFYLRSEQQPDIVSNHVPQAVPIAAKGGTRVPWVVATLVLAAAFSVFLVRDRALRNTLWDERPTVAAFWRGFLQRRLQTDVILPDDSVSLIEDITHHPISLSDYVTRNYMRQIQASPLSADQKFDLDNISSHNLISFGAVRAAHHMIEEIPGVHPSNITLARYYKADDLKQNNIILIGGQKSNPWVHLFDEQINFVTDYDYDSSTQFIRNSKPEAGEHALYIVPKEKNMNTGYATISYLPNPSHAGNALILAGTDSDATNAAAEFLSSEEDLKKLKTIFQTKRFPYFEVLLKTSHLNGIYSGTSFSSEVLAYRTYPDVK